MRLVIICRSIIGGGETGESGKPCLASKIERTTLRYASTRPDDVLLREAKNSVAKNSVAEGAGGCATRITDGRRFRVLAFVDGYTRKRLALARRHPAFGPAGAREQDDIIRTSCRQRTIGSDNGTEFTSMAILR